MPFLTPQEQDGAKDGAVLLSNIHSNPEILRLIQGAIDNLCYPWKWEQSGSMTPQDATFYFNEMVVTVINDLCQAIADCISNQSSPAYEAIKKLIQQGIEANPTAPTYITGGQDKALVSTCDNDIIFGQVTGLVDLIHNSIRDVFEAIEVESNLTERANILVDNVPFLSEGLDYIDQILEELAEGYNGAYNDTLRNKFRCDLYCMAKQNPSCKLTFNEMATYFLGLNGDTLLNVEFVDMLQNLLDLAPLSGNSIVYASSALFCLVLAYGSNWTGMDAVAFQRNVMAYTNDPDNDWAVLCTACASTWVKEFDFSQGTQGWVPENEPTGSYPNIDQAVYENGRFYNRNLGAGSSNAILTIKRTFTNCNITRVQVYYQIDVGSLGQRRLFMNVGSEITLANTPGTWVADQSTGWNPANLIKIALHKGSTFGKPFSVSKVVLYGSGSYPF